MEICERLGELLGVSYDKIVQSRVFHILTEGEVQDLEKQGFYFQLHTHRHTFPPDEETTAIQEIRDNREAMQGIVNKPLVHLAYPSGIWNRVQWPWLEQEGVQTAATSILGWNDPETPLLGLRRLMDSEALSRFTFEAELCGFMDMVRASKRWIKKRMGVDQSDGIY